jgi:hypothetical protein
MTENVRMPFGKYRGTSLSELPDEYLDWLHGLNDLREPLRAAVDQEWRWRFGDVASAAEARRVADQIITVGYRGLALECHPDRGGRTEDMQAVNAAAAWLRRAARMVPQ